MGIQNVTLPTAAGSSSIMANQDVPAIVASWETENWGLTGMWARPYNDNFTGETVASTKDAHYLDNLDLLMLSLPIETGGLKITPWAMYGIRGVNTFRVPRQGGGFNYVFQGNSGGNLVGSLDSIPFGSTNQQRHTGKTYGSLFWAGLPVIFDHDRLRLEFEANYGWSEAMGKYDVVESWYGIPYGRQRAGTERSGWLFKGLAEYRLD